MLRVVGALAVEVDRNHRRRLPAACARERRAPPPAGPDRCSRSRARRRRTPARRRRSVIALAVAANVSVEVSTSSPRPTPRIRSARCSAAVPLDSATACGTPTALGELALERVDVRAERRDPVRVERVEQQLALARADVGRRQIDACGAHDVTL